MNLVEERNKWRKEFEQGNKPDCQYLNDYRKYRNSEYWRASRYAEQICEYILYLEDQLTKENKDDYIA